MLHPRFVEGLDWVKCSHRSIYGPVVSDWKRVGDTVHLKLLAPVGSTAELPLPAATSITENDRPAAESTGVKRLPAKGCVKLQVESDSYNFEVQL